ncbi:MAG: hypothetical protein JW920_09315, partial [Deltaproteobacteria bacterium]|nr:hypothetical protein [Deltaproteobacteria bacterium]
MSIDIHLLSDPVILAANYIHPVLSCLGKCRYINTFKFTNTFFHDKRYFEENNWMKHHEFSSAQWKFIAALEALGVPSSL